MANITVDISARVTGYEDSIRKLQAALSKIDPGSDMGKSITKAMEQAQTQVKALSKNMFPKASSDTQIDSIIEKTNRAGEAIQRVASLMQSVQIGDLNLGALGGEFETFKSQISSLQAELENKLSAGLVKAIGESDQLKTIFKELGTDLSKATSAVLFEDLSKGAKKATDDVANLEKKLETAKTSISNYQVIDSALKSSKLGTLEGRTALDDELKTITGSYDAVFEKLRTTMTEGLNKLKTDTKLDTNGLLKIFFSDLTPENVQSHIQNLFNTLSSQGVFGENEKRKFYEAIFGSGDYSTNNINLLTKSIGLDKAYEQYKVQFQEFYQKVVNDLEGKDQAQIGRLINEDQLDKAINATTKALDNAYNKIFNSIKQNQERLNNALTDKDNLVLQLGAAQQARDAFSTAEQELRSEIERVSEKNKNLEDQIAQLREQLNQKLNSEANNIRGTGKVENQYIGSGMRDSLEITEAYKNQLDQVAAKEQALGKLQGVVQRWFSIYAAIRMVRQAIDSVISTIKELDATITEIAIVTSMDQSELWDQMPKYTQLARDYAASISGVYQVSQLYYQQGLQTADVMALTEQTLKMARISGLDYAQATDYMTNAVRSFKMEMTDAQRVVDVYSSIAASSATSVTELASAMSKTASSAQAVGSSFENTTAMMAVMIEATRESAENIGSAMKSIISRYGEMTSDPSKLVDSEGQEMSLNRVDKALQTVGISIHNAVGEFRNFDEVIMELAEKWDTIDTNTQRYIATIMAGNRQQSRFLALVSSYDRLKELSAEAAESEDASQLQFLKTLDSVAAKTQQFQTSVQALYVNSGLEDFYKKILDWANKAITSLDQLSDRFGLFASIGKIGTTFTSLATLVTNLFAMIKMSLSRTRAQINAEAELDAAKRTAAMKGEIVATTEGYQEMAASASSAQQQMTEAAETESQKRIRIAEDEANKTKGSIFGSKTAKTKVFGMGATALGLAATTAATSIDVNQNRGLKSGLTAAGSVLQGIGTGFMIGGGAGALIGTLTAIPGLIEAIGMASESTSEKIQRLQDNLTEATNARIKSQDELKTLVDYKKKYEELYAIRNDSNESYQEYIKLNQEIAAAYPTLISGMDEEGNYLVELTKGYESLLAIKQQVYNADFIKEGKAQIQSYGDRDALLSLYGYKSLGKYINGPLDSISGLNESDNLIGLLSHQIEQMPSYDLSNKAYSEILSEAFSSAWGEKNLSSITEGLATTSTSDINKIFSGYNNTEAIKDLSTLYDRGLQHSAVQFNGIFGESAQLITDLLFTTGQILDNTNGDIREVNEQLSQIFGTRIIFNSDLLGNIAELKAIMPTMQNAQEKIIEGLNITAVSDSIKSLNLEVDSLSQNWINDNIANEWEDFKKTLPDGADLGNAWTVFISSIDDMVQAAYSSLDFYQGLTTVQSQEVEKLYKNSQDYTFDQMVSSLNELDVENEELRSFILSALIEDSEFLINQFKSGFIEKITSNKITTINGISIDSLAETFSSKFGGSFLNGILNKYDIISSNTGLTKKAKSSQMDALTSLYNSIQDNTEFTLQEQLQLLTAINNADLTSNNGINTLIEELENKGININETPLLANLVTFRETLMPNIEAEIQQYFSSIESAAEDYLKIFSSANNGMNLKTAQEVAGKLGKTLKDFEVHNGKFYYNNIEEIREAYLKENEDLEQEIVDSIKSDYENIQSFAKPLWQQINSGFLNVDTLKQTLSLDMYNDDIWNEYSSISKDTLISEYTKYKEAIAEKVIDESTTFLDYLEIAIGLQFEDSGKKLEEYIKQTQAISQLKSGDIKGFLSTIGIQATDELINQILSGDISNLDSNLKEYAGLIYDTFHAVRGQVVNSLIASVGGNGSNLIKVTDTNKQLLTDIMAEGRGWITGDITVGNYVTIAAEKLMTDAEKFQEYIALSFETTSEKIKALSQYHQNQYSNNEFTAIDTILDKTAFSYEELLNYLIATTDFDLDTDIANLGSWMSNRGLAFNSAGEVIIEDYVKWIQDLNESISVLQDSGANQQELNAAQAKLEQARNAEETAIAESFDNILKDYSNIGADVVESLANALNMSYGEITNYLINNYNGTYSLDLNKLSSLMQNLNGKISEATLEAIEKSISSIGDSFLNNIKNANTYAINGASNLQDIETFRQSYADIVKETLDEEAFRYSSITQSFVLDPAVMQKYRDAQKQLLINMGYTAEFVDTYIEDQTNKAIQNSITLDGLFNAQSATQRNEEANKLFNLIQNLSNYSSIVEQASQRYFGETVNSIEDGFEAIISVLSNGGQDAVDLLNWIKPDASAEELASVYSNAINRLNNALTDAENFVVGSMVNTTSKLYEILSRVNPENINADGVITAAYDMVEVYAAIYAEMTKTAGATTAGLNDAYAKLLIAQDQTNIDITEALKNGNGMSYADFGNLLAKYDIKFEDYMTEHWDTVMRDGFGNIRITDWEGFAKNIFKTDNLDAIRNTDEYISAFKAYNDGLIELNKNTEKNIKDEILQITSVKAGDQLNLSYLWSALQNTVDEAIKNIIPENYRGNVDLANRPIVPAEKMKQVFSEFEDDYATLYSQSFMSEDFGDYARNVGVLFTSITASGEVIENLASYAKALYDEAAGDIDRMRELDKIENGGKGLMLFGEMSSSYEHLAEIADDIHIRAAFKDDINYYLKALQAVGANYADGILTFSEDADMLAIADILDVLSDLAGIDLGEEGKAAIRDAVDDLLKNIASLISNGMKGSLTNTDAASLSQWYKSTAKNYGAIIGELDFTKTAEGLKLTETSLANVYDLMKRIDGIKADALLDDIISTRESFQSLTGALREFNDVMRLKGIDASTNKLKNFNGELSNTAKMMQDVVQKAMTNPDSMNFMSNKLPDDMQTAVNAWENASQAIKTITAAEKSGYMGVQDFYNIVNTASSMMEAAGKTFEVAGMDAATLLQKGAQSLKVVDGKLTVDISSAGLNIVGSADQLKQNMTSGINELADAEIAIIDAEIQVLEILAAMEQMGDMDVDIDNDGLSFEIGDIFKDDGNFTDIEDGANNMKDYLAKLKEVVDTSQETIDTFSQFKINGTSLYELLSASAETWKQVFGSEENVSKFMQKFTKGIKGWDLEGNLQSDVLEFMKGLGQEYSIELGDSGVFHMNASGISYVIDFSDEKRMDAAREAAESLKLDIGESDEEFKKYLQDLVEKGSTENKESTLSFKENYVLKVATGQIEVVKDEKTGKDQYKVGGKLYNSKSVAAAAADLMQAGAKADWEKLSKRTTELGETETISGTLKVNNAEIIVESDGKGNLIYKTPDGKYEGTSLDDFYTQWFEGENPGKKREENGLEFKKWQVKQGIIVETVFEVENGREGNVKTNENLRKAIQNAISNGIDESKITDLKGSKAFEVELDSGIKVTIPKEKLQLGADGKPLPESIQDYLNENFNAIDLDLKDTISRAITEAFTNLSTILSSLDSQPADNVATALQNITTFATQALTAITSLVNKIKELSTLSNFEMPSSEDNKSSKKPGRKNESGFDANSARGQAEAYRKELEEVSSTEVKNTAEFDTSMATSNATNLWAILEQIINAEIQIAIELTQDTEHSKIVLEQIRNLLDEIEGKKNKQIQINSNSVTAATAAVSELKKEIDGEHTMTVTAVLNSSAVDGYTPPNKTAYVNYVPVMSGGAPSGGSTGSVQGASQFLSKPPRATGNIGLAKAKGTQTLMGELGPELVVSNGHYFVAGQNGAEMVNLANDAIVFNHLQTEQLLKKGMSNGRGKAVTSEKSAIAFAGGNINGGPAMASASAALAQLKKLRAMWESLKNASVSDLAGAGGGGGGGGGGGDNAKVVDPSIWVDTVERWYNLMQKIAKLEKEITHEETLRSKLQSDWNANGNHYYASQKRSLEALRDQIDAQEQLNLSREAYYDQRVEALKNQPFGKLIEFDNEGQMRFQKGAMEWLTDLAGFDSLGKANYTDEEKYNILVSAGYGDYMKYSEGGEIKMDGDSDGEITDEERQSFYGEATKAFWDKIDEYKEATQSLWDSIKEGEEDLLKLQADQNKLLEEIRENQMAVEDAVLEAIEDMRQRQIDALQDERDKLEESTQKYIDGLTDALNNEKQMYENQEDESNLNQQRRRLAILQRSGGSAQDIANLRSEINQSERERYFNLQQQQIDAIQQASELEIERMDSQIELMTEALDYQKEYGLLWGNVYEVMDGTAAAITQFILHGNSDFWALSPLGTDTQANSTLFQAEQWRAYRDDLNMAKANIGENGITAKDIKDNVQLMVTMTRQQMRDKDYTIFDEAMKKEFGAGYDAGGAYKNLFYSEYMQHGDITKATATARAKYAADKAAAEAAARAAAAAKAAPAPAPAPAASSGGGGSGSGNSKTCADCAVNCGGACTNKCSRECSNGSSSPNAKEKSGTCKGGCTADCKNDCKINTKGGTKTGTGKYVGGQPKAAGGYVNHGLYELGELGTETVLTASQTKILRDNILSNRPNSLISLLKSYNENYDGINNPLNDLQSPIEDNSIVIERVEMTMDVKQLANDYDARRAGEQALNEMMRIARKTSAANSIRR